MDEQELMALPEITDLSYKICEGRHENGPHDYYRQEATSVRIYPSGEREVGIGAFGYGLQFKGEFSNSISIVFNTFLDYRDWERGLPAEQIIRADYQPGLEKMTSGFWVLMQHVKGIPWDELAPVARIHNDLVQATLYQIYSDWLSLLIPPRQVLRPQQ